MTRRTRTRSSKTAVAQAGNKFAREMANHFATKKERKTKLREMYVAASKRKEKS